MDAQERSRFLEIKGFCCIHLSHLIPCRRAHASSGPSLLNSVHRTIFTPQYSPMTGMSWNGSPEQLTLAEAHTAHMLPLGM